MSVEAQRVYEAAEAIEDAGGIKYTNYVEIVHEEGTKLSFANAYAMRYYDREHGNWGASSNPGQWLVVFTEHHGIHVYPIDDLHSYDQYQRLSIENHESVPDDSFVCDDCHSTFVEAFSDGGPYTCLICDGPVREMTPEEKEEEKRRREQPFDREKFNSDLERVRENLAKVKASRERRESENHE